MIESKGLSVADIETERMISGSKLPIEIFAYYKGRQDAIEEFIDVADNYLLSINTAHDILREIAEQLKGERND